jgi:hypothetical protein
MTYGGFKQPSGNRLKNGPILLVTPSEKPCQFYKVDRDQWVQDTIKELRKYTTREIIVRDKGLRPDRIKDKSVAAQCFKEEVWALVTYQSMAALEAMHYGIPAFTMAPCCVDSVANKDLSRIEDPHYPSADEFKNLLHYLAYCQYTVNEFSNGYALRLIEEMELYD